MLIGKNVRLDKECQMQYAVSLTTCVLCWNASKLYKIQMKD